MHKLKLYILIVFATGFCLQLYSQSYSPQQITLADRIESAALNAPPELAYIQTSKDIYETGEDLWFKLYLLDAQTLIPSLRSKTLYLQLLNENDKGPVWQEKYEIQNGSSNGRVYLSTELSEGNYLLAAYSPNSFFSDTTEFKAIRRIKIVTDISSKKVETAKPDDISNSTSESVKETSIQFNTFPEGGNLVSGIESKLAFKAVNKSGEPVDVNGTLFEDNIPLIEFNSTYAGMGSFNFTPDKNKKYFVRLTKPSIDSTFLLPGILPEGMLMSLVARNQESLSFKISQSQGLNESDFYIRVQCRGVVYGMTTGKLNREILMKIPLSLLPQGIAEVTLFNSDLVPVAERLVYINQDKKLNITAELSERNYPLRGKAVLKIKVKNEKGQPVMANLGVTVFDKVYQNQRDSSNIFSHVYLSSQLKGRIYNPSYYFNSKSQVQEEALDLLMLTQGWRRYVWNETNLGVLEKNDREIISDGTPGVLYYPSRKRKIPQEETFVMAFSPNLDTLNVVVPADSSGTFAVNPELLKRWEGDYVYLKPFGSWGSKATYKRINPEIPEYALHIKLTDPFEVINRLIKITPIIYPIPGKLKIKETSHIIPFEKDIIEIESVTIKGRKEQELHGKYMATLDSLAKYDLYNDYVCVNGVLNCPRHIRENPSTKPIPGEDYFQIIAYGSPAEHLIRVRYLPPNFSEDELLKMSNLSRVKSYRSIREFYKPNYDKNTGDEMIPDFRNTLLWEPSVFTNTNGEATVSFFCSDINASFVGRIEGVGGDGLLGSSYFNFNVRKVKITPKER